MYLLLPLKQLVQKFHPKSFGGPVGRRNLIKKKVPLIFDDVFFSSNDLFPGVNLSGKAGMPSCGGEDL